MNTLLKTTRQRAAHDSTVKITLESENEYKRVDQTQCNNDTMSLFIQPPEPVTFTSMYDETLIITNTNNMNNGTYLTKAVLSKDNRDSSFDLTQSLFLLQYKPNEEDCFLIKSIATGQLLTVRSNTNAPMLCVYRYDFVDNENKEEKENSTMRYAAWFRAIPVPNDNDSNSNSVYCISNSITKGYLSSNTLKCNQVHVGKKEKWQILYSCVMKIHIYGLNKCEIYNTAIEIGGKIYHWGINDKVNVYPSSIVYACGDDYDNEHLSHVSHAYGTLPLFLTKLCRRKTICRLIKSEEPLKKDLSQIMDGLVNEWNGDDIKYHYKHNNSNNFTFTVLKKVISGFEDTFNDKYREHINQNAGYRKHWEDLKHKVQSWISKDYANNHERYRIAANLENLHMILITSKKKLIKFVGEKNMGYEGDTSLIDIIHDYVSIDVHGSKKLQILKELCIDIPMKHQSLLPPPPTKVNMFKLLLQGAVAVGLLYFCSKLKIKANTIMKLVLVGLIIAATFVATVYDPDKVLEFVSTELVEFHLFVCCVMALYSFGIAIKSFNYFHWTHSLLFSFILFLFSVFYYVLFYVYNTWVSVFTAISVPIAYKKIKTVLDIQEIPNIKHVTDIYGNIVLEKEIDSQAKPKPISESKRNSNLNCKPKQSSNNWNNNNVNNSRDLPNNDTNNTNKKARRLNVLSVGGIVRNKTGNNNGNNNNNSTQTKQKRKRKRKRKKKHINININSFNYDYGHLTHDWQFEMIEKKIIIDQVIDEVKNLRKQQIWQARIVKCLLFLVIMCYIGRITARIKFSYGEPVTNIIDYFVGLVNSYI